MQQAIISPLFSTNDLEEARRVLNLEAEALVQLAQPSVPQDAAF